MEKMSIFFDDKFPSEVNVKGTEGMRLAFFSNCSR